MIKVYVIKGLESEVPLAEVRTDGTALDWTVDNTDGKLPSMVGNSLAKLKLVVAKSSNMSMEEPKGPTAHFLRYLLDNGDIVEITTDGRTAILNGKLLQEAEKNAIFSAIRSGELKVSRRADTAAPVPIMPSQPKSEQGLRRAKKKYDKGLVQGAKQQNEAVAAMQKQANRANDDMIEKMDLYDLDTPDDAAMTRSMLYFIRHGGFKGEVDA